MNRKKFILQYGNVAGWPYLYALSLRNIGVPSISVKAIEEELGSYPNGVVLDRKLPTDVTLTQLNQPRLCRVLKKASYLFSNICNFNLIHYHGSNILPKYSDLKLFKFCRIPMIISWSGSDARITRLARKNNPYFFRQANDPRDKIVEKKLGIVSKYVRFVATDPEIADYCLPFFEKVFLLRQPVNMAEHVCSYPSINQSIPIIYHIPTYSGIKGTNYLVSAVDRLKSERLRFEFKMLEPNFTQKEMKKELAKPDIYVDELLCGSHGLTAVEAMASGKPTVTYIREDLIDRYPKELPLVNANPDTIYHKLRELIVDAELRHELGKRGRAYAEKYHSLEAVAPELLNIYREIGMSE